MRSTAKADEVEYRVYADVDTAYTDAPGRQRSTSCDTSRRTPSPRAPDEFGDRYMRDRQSSSFTYAGLPDLRPALRRQARAPGLLHGDRPGGDHRGHLQRHPHPGHVGHRARSSTATATTPAYCVRLNVERGQPAARRGRLRPQPAGRPVVQRRRRPRRVGRGRRQPAAGEPRHRVPAQGRPRLLRVPARCGDAKGYDRPVPSRLEHGLPEPAELPRSRCTRPRRCRRRVRTTAFYSQPGVRRTGRRGQPGRHQTRRPSTSTRPG